MKAGLKILSDYKDSGRKIAVLSDMLELGPDSPDYPGEVGKFWARQILRICTSPEPFPKNMQKLHKKESLTKNEMVFLQ